MPPARPPARRDEWRDYCSRENAAVKPDSETGRPSDFPSMFLKITISSLPCFRAAISVSASGHGVALFDAFLRGRE